MTSVIRGVPVGEKGILGAFVEGHSLNNAMPDIVRTWRTGAELVHEPRSQPSGRSGRYRDLDGNVVELTQRE